MSNTHEGARIHSVWFGPEPDRGINVVDLGLGAIDGGWRQSFQMCMKATYVEAAKLEILDLFCVDEESELIGKDCFALRAWPYLNEPIVGVETVEGKRFTRTAFCRRMGIDFATELTWKRKRCNEEIDYARQRLYRALESRRTVEKDYADWDS
jgi:hypothetical protein